MKQVFKHNSLLCVLSCTIFIFEAVFRLTTVRGFFSVGLLLSFFFSITVASVFCLILLIIKNNKIRNITASVLLFLLAVLYGAQIVYNDIFHTYYTIYSMAHGGQVMQFYRDIMIGIGHQAIPLLVIVASAIIAAYFLCKSKPSNSFIVPTVSGIASLVLAVLIVICGGKGVNTPYDSVFRVNSIDSSIKNLGFSAAMLLDTERLLLGFEPVIETGGEQTEEIESTPEYGYNKLDIDFKALADSEEDSVLKQMNLYFGNTLPTKQNEKTGIFAGKNLVMVVAESFSSYAVSEKYTPTLYKMQNEGYNFTNFYNPIWGVSTSDGEYVATTGLIPKAGVWSMQESSDNSLPFTMGNQFRKLGVTTRAYHNHYAEYYGRTESHPNLGYIYKGLGTGLNVKEQWPESDLEMLQLTTPEYLTPDPETGKILPFHTYYMTVSGHLNYNFAGHVMCVKHKSDVADLEMSEPCKAYIACQMELDLAMEHLLSELEKAGELENTVIVISGDHYPYGLTYEEISEFLGHSVEEKFEIYKSSLIIYNPGMEPETIDKYCSSLDIIPTVSNLFGFEYDSRLLMGRDVFSDSDPLVIFKDRSWITDKGAYNAETGEIIPFNGAEISDDYINAVNNRVQNKFYYSALILERDYYRYLGL